MLTGCSTSQPIKHNPYLPIKIDDSVQLKKSDINVTQVTDKSLNSIIRFSQLSIDKHIKELDRNADFIYHGMLRVNFKVKDNKLITENKSLCYIGDCTSIYKTDDYQNFISDVKKTQDNLHSNISRYAKVYKQNENALTNWIKKVENINTIHAKFRNRIINDDKLLDKLSNKAGFEKLVVPSKEELFVEFLESKEKSLKTFLNNRIFGYFYPYNVLNYENYKLIYNSKNKKTFVNKQEINFNTINNLYLELNEMYYYFLPKVFTTNDSNIKLQLTLNNNGTYKVKVTNLTNKFIELSSISLYLDDRIRNLNVNTQLPPKAISENFRYIPLPEGTTANTKINNINQVRDFGAAVSYIANSKKETLYTEKKIRTNR